MAPPPALLDPDGPTGKLCTWIDSLALDDVPEELLTRIKYIMLDGILCALVGPHLPWSERAVKAVLSMESEGPCTIIGWNKKVGPLPAALLNSTFIQGFEMDDYHRLAPLHSNSIILPALFAAAERQVHMGGKPVTGKQFMLAALVGYEVGPRVGNALYGEHMLTRGWHSGAIFGPSASAASVSKLLSFTPPLIESALGSACTQACGLMSAQFESDVKRMQCGFASRTGLFSAILASHNYLGIKAVYERPYGGFLSCFGGGSGKEPEYKELELVEGLGERWLIEDLVVKPYCCQGGTHGTVDCCALLQQKYPETFSPENLKIDDIEAITIEMSEVVFKHSGFEVTRPLTSTGAQMSNMYIAAVQLLDGEIAPKAFGNGHLDRDAIWELVRKMRCEVAQEEGWGVWNQRVRVQMKGGETKEAFVDTPRGVRPVLSNEEVLGKWRGMVGDVVDDGERIRRIEEMVLGLEGLDNVGKLVELLAGETRNPIA